MQGRGPFEDGGMRGRYGRRALNGVIQWRFGSSGAGYVGLVSGACFADFGWDVTCVDKNEDRVAKLKKGENPIYEPGLDELVERHMASRRLQFSNGLPTAV